MRHLFVLLALALLAFAHSEARQNSKAADEDLPLGQERKQRRIGKLFSLFNVVRFDNDACTTQSDTSVIGQCLTQKECSDAAGNADGNCASGFGVCCMFTTNTCGSTISRNNTYIRNEGFPTGVTQTTASECTFTFARSFNDICQIRLDFESLTTVGPSAVAATRGQCLTDVVTVAGSVSAINIPTVCGQLSGQHMYIEAGGTTGEAGTIDINFGALNPAPPRNYDILVRYIECSNAKRAPQGCLQYFTGVSGTITTYNHQAGTPQLSNQNYNFCLRQEEGYCQYDLRAPTGQTPASFVLDPIVVAGPAAAASVAACTDNFLRVQSTAVSGQTLRCGNILNDVAGSTVGGVITSTFGAPFTIGYQSPLITAANSIGFSLDFSQRPC